MSDSKTETFLILKYGSFEEAFIAWLREATTHDFTDDENDAMAAYAKQKYPNLNLTRIGNYRKD